MKKYAFTIVELLVVITILTILGTIAFISLNNFSAFARDAKRLSDVRSLYTKLTLENVKGTRYSNLVKDITTSEMQINGNLVVVGQGVPNFETLKENRDNFLDPTTNTDYQVGFYEGGLQPVTAYFSSGLAMSDGYSISTDVVDLLASTTNIQSTPSMIQIATYSEEHNTAVLVGNFNTNGKNGADTKGLIKGEDGEILVNNTPTTIPGAPNPLSLIPETIYGDEGKTEIDICNKWVTDNIPSDKGEWIWVPAREEYFIDDGFSGGTKMTDDYYKRQVEYTEGDLTREFICLGFAVARYEMSHDDIGIPDSTLGGTDYNTRHYDENKDVLSIANRYPIADINQQEAITACTSIIPSIGGTDLKTHLITNNEWMTIARNIELQIDNWSTGTIGEGHISNGLSNDATHGCIAVNDVNGNNIIGTPDGAIRTNDIYPELTRSRASKTGKSDLSDPTDCNTKRQQKLSTRNTIWDLNGNIYEHVNKANTIDGIGYITGQTKILGCAPTNTWDSDLNGCWEKDIGKDRLNYGPYISGGMDKGFGNIRSSDGVPNNIFLRGGSSYFYSKSGIYLLTLNFGESFSNRDVGFRCTL